MTIATQDSKAVLSIVQTEPDIHGKTVQKIVRIKGGEYRGVLETLSKEYVIETIRTYASSKEGTKLQEAFISSHDSYLFEVEGLSEYPAGILHLQPLKAKTQAFMHSLINQRAQDHVRFDGISKHILEEQDKLPRIYRKALHIKTRHMVDAVNKMGWYETECRFVINGKVYMLGYLSDFDSNHYWQAREWNPENTLKRRFYACGNSLYELLCSCDSHSRK